MKKIYIIILQVLFLIFNGKVVIQAQQCFDFYRPTPNGTNVKACEGGGHSPFEIQQADIQSRTYAIEVL
ncbi:hypothetical protein [Tannerella forsythia]|uniref:Uncharacterized protein n=1 Tax=Tannerella forsythia TaxID=28112 RepID=A0A3P1YPT4_TANFO|nr:hypothetical protein [Tannerella forsythia]RRD72962.1 hypothetical protein EII41_10330 [Tannerella forsythia]